MRNRLALAVALAILGVAITGGAVSAQSSSVVEVGAASVEIDIPAGSELLDVEGQLPACSNLGDDDEDGHIDLEDPGCTGPLDDDEVDEPADPGAGEDPTNDPQEPVEEIVPELDPDAKPGPVEKLGAKKGKNGKGKAKGGKGDKGVREVAEPPNRKKDGSPSRSNPTLSIADLGAAPIGVPNFMIDQFKIPPFLLPIYQACGTEYGIPWQVLASINRIETAFGTNLNVSSAGAVGWMQFLPSTWKAHGVDANRDGRKDPYNPVDAICSAANYLDAAGGTDDLRRSIFAYNHADWYVDEVLLYARQYGKLPSSLISSLTGLTEGAHFPVAARARYADDISERRAQKRAKPRKGVEGNAADVIRSSPTRRGIDIFAKKRAPVVAVNDGVIKRLGRSQRLGNYAVLEDAFGNRFTYAQLGKVAKVHPVAKRRELRPADFEIVRNGKKKPKRDESTPKARAAADAEPAAGKSKTASVATGEAEAVGPVDTEDDRRRLYALPERKRNVEQAEITGQLDDVPPAAKKLATFKGKNSGVLKFNPKTMRMRDLREGSKVLGGTLLGRIAKKSKGIAPHVHFAIRPAGRGAKKIDPKPILDGWKLLESTAIYRAKGKNPFQRRANVGQVLLMSKSQLERRVLSDRRISIYSCGREDVGTGQIDRRVLAALAYLSERGFRLVVTSLTCGHSYLTASGNVSHHSSGNAVDIARVNGLSILGNQGRGSITESVLQELLLLQGSLAPAQIISLMEIGGPTIAQGDHADHIHVGWQPTFGTLDRTRASSILRPGQWERLIDRIAGLNLPTVPTKPSEFSLPAGGQGGNGGGGGRASAAHVGD
ncbi:MAG: lytic murein transglycosylase [Solirubrobacterales bacterium]